jgi:hypothetical protein
MVVRYYRIPQGRNKGFAVVFGEWPPGSLRSHGYSAKHFLFSRVATKEEEEDVKTFSRFVSIRYKTVRGLLADEKRVLNNGEEFGRLRKALLSVCV